MLALLAAIPVLKSTVSTADGERLESYVSVASVLTARFDSIGFYIGLGTCAAEGFDAKRVKTALPFR